MFSIQQAASFPEQPESGVPPVAAASVASIPPAASVASAASADASSNDFPSRLRPVEEYPSTVQELVMNGFSLGSVVKAMELVGNSFDDMLALLMANTS